MMPGAPSAPGASPPALNPAQQPQLVAQLARQLATYTAYVDGKMASEELAGYDCVSPAYPSEFWGNFTGPCCKPKHPRAHP